MKNVRKNPTQAIEKVYQNLRKKANECRSFESLSAEVSILDAGEIYAIMFILGRLSMEENELVAGWANELMITMIENTFPEN